MSKIEQKKKLNLDKFSISKLNSMDKIYGGGDDPGTADKDYELKCINGSAKIIKVKKKR